MERITVSGPDGTYEIPEGKESAAARRLASFENAWERLTARQGEVTARMEALKAEGKQKTPNGTPDGPLTHYPPLRPLGGGVLPPPTPPPPYWGRRVLLIWVHK